MSRPAQSIPDRTAMAVPVFGLNERFSFKKRKMLIEIAKPKMTGLYCTQPIHRQLKLNQLPCIDIGYWIGKRRRTLRSRCGLCCNTLKNVTMDHMLCISKARSLLARLTERNHFQAAL